MATVLRAPLLAYAFLVDRLRRLPIFGRVMRHTSLLAAAVLVAAALAFSVWAATVAPQRVALADLVAGKLSYMQTWITISGDLSGGTFRNATYRYELTDPTVPNAVMNVVSEVEQHLGRATISGQFTGPREPAPVGYRWIGTMHADPIFVPAPAPPWVAMMLVVLAGLVLVAGRISYPMFFDQAPTRQTPRPMTVAVGVWRGSLRVAEQPVSGTVIVQPGAPVELRVGTAATQTLRLHSAHTGVEVGELRHLGGAQPALTVRLSTEGVTLTFGSVEERDVAFAALVADAEEWSRQSAPPKYQAAT